MNTALEYSTRVVQEGGRRCKKSTLNDLVHLTPLRIPLMNPPYAVEKISFIKNKVYKKEGRFYNAKNDSLSEGSKKTRERLAVLERDPNFQLWLGAFVKRCTCV